jgi:alpha-1,3-mannosyltransferase
MVGGIESVVGNLVRRSRMHGVEADVLHISPAIPRLVHETCDGAQVWRAPLWPNRLVGVAWPIREILGQYEIWHVHDPQLMAISANVLSRSRGEKKVLSTHGGFFHTRSKAAWKSLHWRFVARAIMNRYDYVLASSASDFQIFSPNSERLKLAPNGVDTRKYADVRDVRRRDALHWIYWGRLAKNKRVDLLIDLVKQAHDAGLQARLTIAGEDFDKIAGALEKKAAQLGVSSHIRFLGTLSDDELKAEISTHTIFVTASEHEGFGLAIVEAMSAGLIVFCRDIAPINAFVTPDRDGAFLKFDGGEGDMASIGAIAAAPDKELGCRRLESRSAAARHDWTVAIDPFLQVYEELSRR